MSTQELVPAGAFVGPDHQDETVLQLVIALEDSGGVTETTLDLPADVSYDVYTGMGRFLGRIKRSSSWWLGDFLLYGEGTYGERYAQAASETGLDEQALLHYVFVCRSVPPKERRAALSFSTHAEVARLPTRERKAWLDKAEKHGWKRADLRAAMKAKRKDEKPNLPGTESPEEQLREVAEAILRDAQEDENRVGFYSIPVEDIVRLRAALGYDEE